MRYFTKSLSGGEVRVFRLTDDGLAERAHEGGWVSVPTALEKLITDPNYPEIDEATAMALLA